MDKIALVTGATSGIGEASAKILAEEGYNLIITGRRDSRLGRLASKLIDKYHIDCFPLCFDIRKIEEVEDAFFSLPENWKNIDVLINNAGLAAGVDPIHKAKIEDWDQMIDTNLKGLLYITRIVTPGMVEKQKGTVINVSSIAGKEAYGYGSVYCATKHGVEAITKAMRIDLNPYGIKVGSVSPGAVETEFSAVRLKDKDANKKVYAGFSPLQAIDIAEAIRFMITRPSHVNIADLFILPTAQASPAIINKK